RHLPAGRDPVRCVVYRGVGGREVVAVEQRPDPQPDRFEVVIAPPFAGINPADVLQREGKHPVPPGSPKDIPGLEVAGPVVALGARVVANVRTPELRPRVGAMGAEALPADRAFARVRELGGADVILELVGAPHMADNMTALARRGRLMLVGAKPGDEAVVVLR